MHTITVPSGPWSSSDSDEIKPQLYGSGTRQEFRSEPVVESLDDVRYPALHKTKDAPADDHSSTDIEIGVYDVSDTGLFWHGLSARGSPSW